VYRIGRLGRGVVLAHGVHLSPDEISLISRREASIVHNPWANTLLGSGLAPYREMLDSGINVALGVDASPGFSIPEEMQLALGLSMIRGKPITIPDAYWSATRGGYRAFGLAGGVIRRGFLADLVLWRPSTAWALSPEEAVVMGEAEPYIVVVGGEVVVREGRPVRIKDKLLEKAYNHVAARINELYGDAGYWFYS
jgi:cytosine/adenosine deaminase-related metal-dependent hydrolase